MEENVDIASSKKEAILERLNKRNKERQNYLETKLELRNKETTDFEGADYFVQAFTEQAKEIEKRINKIHFESVDLSRLFASINGDLQDLQRYLSNSTIFLPDYNIKACQTIVNELTTSLEEVRTKYMPKKRFGFHNRHAISSSRKQPKTTINTIGFSEKTNSSSAITWTLSNRENEYKLLVGTDVDKKDITISNLKNCIVEIRGHAGSLQISNADNCTFLCGPISRSLFAENCSSCKIIAACQQLRLHSSSNCKLWIHVTSRAIIEDCTQIEVDDYNYEYSGINIDFKKSGLDETANNYRDVADFNWLSPDKPSPNWKLICDDDYKRPFWCKIVEEFRTKNF